MGLLSDKKHLLFDLHGVLISKRDIPGKKYDHDCALIIAEKHNCSFEDGQKLYEQKLRGGFSHSQTMKELGVYKEYIEVFSKASRENGLIIHDKNLELASILYTLAESKKLYVITNNPHAYAVKLIEELGIDPAIFTKIVALEDMPNPKPSFDGFNLIVTGPKEEYVYFGDRMDVDIEPAKAFGIDAVLVNENIIELLRDG